MEEIETKVGKFEIKTPTAGARNQSAIKATHGKELNELEMAIDLLPKCIIKHPFGANLPVKNSLDNMDFKEYDKVLHGFLELIKPDDSDVEKK